MGVFITKLYLHVHIMLESSFIYLVVPQYRVTFAQKAERIWEDRGKKRGGGVWGVGDLQPLLYENLGVGIHRF